MKKAIWLSVAIALSLFTKVSAQNLYVANYWGGIERFSSSGAGTTFAVSGVDNPTGLAFRPVPEPSTWRILAFGIGTLLGGRRLSRRSS